MHITQLVHWLSVYTLILKSISDKGEEEYKNPWSKQERRTLYDLVL